MAEAPTYIVRHGPFRGRNTRTLSDSEMRKMIDQIPSDADCTAGVRMMRFILQRYGANAVVDFAEWGQNILNTTGKINRIDFIPDEGEPTQTLDEKKLLKAAKPNVVTRRTMLTLVPSAILTAMGATRVANRVAEKLYSRANGITEESEQESPASSSSPNPFTKIRGKLDEVSDYPVEAIGAIILTNEIIDMVKEYGEQQFEEISNAVAEIADTMGIGEATPTYRLPARTARNR